MSIGENLLTLSDAARSLPGGGVHVATVHRWRMKGCRGVKLETILRGGVRYTSTEALERFFAATTAAADGHSAPPVTSNQRQRQIEQAERELAQAGI